MHNACCRSLPHAVPAPCLIGLLLNSIFPMHAGDFEWDDRIAAANYAKHGISFPTAREAFNDPFAIERLDDREAYGEDRYILIGMAEGRLLFVAYTMRESTIRIISARGAEPYEYRQYHQENR